MEDGKAVNADLVGTQQHLFRKREQIQQDEHLKDGTWGQYDNGVGSGGQSPDRNNQNGDGTDGTGSGQKDNDDGGQGVSLVARYGKGYGHHGYLRRRYYGTGVVPGVVGGGVV